MQSSKLYNSCAKLLHRLHFGYTRQQPRITLTLTKPLINVLKILQHHGFIMSYVVKSNVTATILLKYYHTQRAITLIKTFSTPNHPITLSVQQTTLLRKRESLSTVFLVSTPRGILSANAAVNQGL